MHRVPRLHLVTPPSVDPEVVDATRRAVAAGAPLVQVRTKHAADRARLQHLHDLRTAVGRSGALCLVNDRVDLSLAVGADGVHLGDDDVPVDVARRLLGPDAVVGATARNPEAAKRAVDAGATYLGVGPAFATRTKTGLPDPIGMAGIAAVAGAVSVPVIAIAGVTVDRVAALREAGAWGVAVVGAVYGADDPAAATAELLDELS